MNLNIKSKFLSALVISAIVAAPAFAKNGGDDGVTSSGGGHSNSGSSDDSGSGSSGANSHHDSNSGSSGSNSGSGGENNNGGNNGNQASKERIKFKGNMMLVAVAEDLATSRASFKLEYKSETKKNKTKSEAELEMKAKFPVAVTSLGLTRENAATKTFKAELMGDTDGDTVLNLIATCQLAYYPSESLETIQYRLKAEVKTKNGNTNERQKVGTCDTLTNIQKATNVMLFNVDESAVRTDLFQITKQ